MHRFVTNWFVSLGFHANHSPRRAPRATLGLVQRQVTYVHMWAKYQSIDHTVKSVPGCISRIAF